MAELTEQRYQQLKRDATKAREEALRARGAHEELMRALKKEFGCDSVEDAEKKLELLEKQTAKAEADLKKALAEYQFKWKQ